MKSISCTAQLRLHFQKKENVRLDLGENSRNVKLNSSQSRPVSGPNQARQNIWVLLRTTLLFIKKECHFPSRLFNLDMKKKLKIK